MCKDVCVMVCDMRTKMNSVWVLFYSAICLVKVLSQAVCKFGNRMEEAVENGRCLKIYVRFVLDEKSL